jgi:hypothetical protein
MYFADFMTSEGFSPCVRLTGTNKRALLQEIRNIAIGGCLIDSSVDYWLSDDSGYIVEARTYYDHGRRTVIDRG